MCAFRSLLNKQQQFRQKNTTTAAKSKIASGVEFHTEITSIEVGDVSFLTYGKTSKVSKDFVNLESESRIISFLESNPWVELSSRDLQTYGCIPGEQMKHPMPDWMKLLAKSLYLKCKLDHVPNHVLVNKYSPGQGVMPHHDGPSYYPQVSVISIGSGARLCFYETLLHSKTDTSALSLYLPRGSLLVFEDSLYTELYHSITEDFEDTLAINSVANFHDLDLDSSTTTIPRDIRYSLTFRYVPDDK